MLEGTESNDLEVSHEDNAEGSVIDQLVADSHEVVYWTCGNQVETDKFENTIELLQEAHGENVEERNQLRDEINDLDAEHKHIERTRDERQRPNQRLAEVKSEFDERTDRIEDLKSEVRELEAQIEPLDEEAGSLVTDDRDEWLDLHREINELEVEADRLESELADVETEIEDVETRVAKRDALEAQREEIDAEIEELRSRIERLETEAIEQFNDQMGQILDLLKFENLERVWIERVETEIREGCRKVRKPTFNLHIVRTTGTGSVYEDTVDHLSESEREVVGMVFALSGYLVHEVYKQVPFMLLDSLEALDADRISMLVDHFSELASNVVVTLLPEDAAAVDESYQRVPEI